MPFAGHTPLVWFGLTVGQIALVLVGVLISLAFLLWGDRKVWAGVMMRKGPNVVGPFGLLQSFADFGKFVLKEITIPDGANKGVFILAPVISFILAFGGWAVIPFAPGWVVSNINVGVLYLFAVSSLGVYGIIMGGWASNSKYPFLGSLRSAAQMVSYEVSIGFVIVTVVLLVGSTNLQTIIQHQAGGIFHWNVLGGGGWAGLPMALVMVPMAMVFFISALAETNRPPFDLPEAESELIAGYHTEYSAMKFSLFFIAEYANMVTASALITSLFFGGWDIPFTQWDNLPPYTVLKTVLTLGAFLTKVLFFLFFFMWIRWTLPRFRYDQLMSLGWKLMLPLALTYVTIVATAVLVLDRAGVARGPVYGAILFGMNVVLAVLLFVVLDRGRLVSPASSRLDREEVARLRSISARNSTLAEKKA